MAQELKYKVVADHAEYNSTFTSYADAYAWLRLVRMTFGSNACLLEVNE